MTAAPERNGAKDPGENARNGDSLLDRIRSVFGLKHEGSLREEFADALAAEENGVGADQFSPEERALLRNILGLRERRVEDAMVPRADIIAVDTSIALGDLLHIFREAGHSRIPVFKETLDDPQGMVHVKDLMNFITQGATLSRAALEKRKTEPPAGLDLKKVNLGRGLGGTRLLRKVLFVPPSMPTLDLLAQMQATRNHMAIVVDEYGGTDGLVTIEDLVEEIVGDIEDEHDAEDDGVLIRQLADGGYVLDARISIEDLAAETGIDVSQDEAAAEVDTLGGFVFAMLGRVPVRGEILRYGAELDVEILDADPRRIKRVRVTRQAVYGGNDNDATSHGVSGPGAGGETPSR
ncbi:MAG: hemolysin family protein [Pseudomonadota bacterium]